MARRQSIPISAETIGTRIKERREALNLTLHALSARTGIDAANLSRLETGARYGDRGPTVATILRVAKALKVEPSDLLAA